MKKLVFAILMFASMATFAQKQKGPVRYQYEPGINSRILSGKITEKFIAYKDNNPVYFFIIKKQQVHVWEPSTFNTLNIGDKHTFIGLVPLIWIPDFFKPIPERVDPTILAATKKN